jgi:hypothetical protein
MRIYVTSKTAVALLAALTIVLAGSLAWAAIPDANGVFQGCVKNGSGDLRLIDGDAGQTCKPNESAVSWYQVGPSGPAGPGVKTIGGLVNIDGTTAVGSGFTSSRASQGDYVIEFPPGTWDAFPVIVVSPFGLPGAFPVAEAGSVVSAGGAATAHILVSSTAGPWTPLDAAFWFVAVAS